MGGGDQKNVSINDKKKKNGSFKSIFMHADVLDWFFMAFGFFGAIGDGMMVPFVLFITSKIMNSVGSASGTSSSNFVHDVNKNAVVVLYMACASFFVCFLEGYCWTRTGERQAARMRVRYLKAVLRQEVSYFDLHVTSTTDVITSVSSDSLVIQDVLSDKVPNFLVNASRFLSSNIVAFALLWRLAIVGFPFMVLLVIPGYMYKRISMRLARKIREEYNQAGTIAEQAISSIRTVYSFVGESKTLAAFSNALEGSVKLGLKQGLAKGLAIGSNGVVYAIWSLIFYYGSIMVMYHGAKGGTVFVVGVTLAIGGLAFGTCFSNVRYFAEASVAGERIMEVIKRVPTIDSENMEGEIIEKVLGEVEFNNVEFVYPSRPESVILNDFCLKVPSGKTVALVGGSGSGKSTVVSLLQRFYDPIGGEILLDGVAIHKLQLKWLRSQMGLVSQEPALFATSIKENILFGREDATYEEIVDAAKASNAHNFISMLPQGYDTQVGERGIQMSGGQKQRIAIARAIVKMPKILLLDEATSALDSESERVVQEALDKAVVGRTTIIIAHRLSTIQNADIIAVVQNGKIMETGSHESLMQNDSSIYTSLVHLQHTKNDQDGDTLSIMNKHHISCRFLSRSSSFNSMTHGGGDVVNYNNVVEDVVNDIDHNTNKKKKKVKVPSFRRLLAMNAPEWKQVCLGCLSSVLFGAVQPISTFATGAVASVYFLNDRDEMKKQIRMYAFCFLGLALASIVFNMLEQYSFAYMGEYLTKRIRERMFSKILTFEVGWFDEDQNSTGVICSRLAKEANVVRSVVGDSLSLVVQTISAMVVTCTMGLIITWRLSIVMISVQPITIFCYYTRRVLLNNMSSKAIKAQDDSSKIAAEAVSNLRIITSFSSQNRILKMLEKAQQGPRHESIRQSWYAGIGLACSQSLIFCTRALNFWYGGKLVSQGYITKNQFFETIMIWISIGKVIADAASSMTNDLAKGSDAVRSVFAILDRYTKIKSDDLEGFRAEKLIGKIVFHDVHFSYPARPNVMVFQGFSIEIDAGKSTALVGESGSGKSTIIGLIERFYDPLKGIVTVDGRDIKTYNLRSLRKHIALVSQEPTLFGGTIRENIVYGAYDDKVDESEIIEASKAANAHDFISSLKDGYDTLCGDRGVQLSGGQKQRIAIARAILKNPEVLLLDEATSALDSQSEKLVQDALEKVMVGRTSVVVAHRLSTIQNCDLIAVLDKGIVVEKGTHSSLLSKGPSGAYYSLVSLQRRPNNIIADSCHEIN
ncbi:putative xenobiotic-transporting ATPase [Medicago truncatula]|uniref:ABC transporter B family protein n=1 Tax=Medicago truncatula TaxID=3880 RepID=G7KJG7_MEDTR|nr:ABC transporter B family member 15 [Medicago truncatula]AES74595.1 ABC transporter B family protein [Medicago truncatula]RHN49926.1 putative xenobiotic-transporting ATPase [Medicago truncatula]